MGKFSEYDQVTSLLAANVFMLDGANGTKIMTAANLTKGLAGLMDNDTLFSMLDEIGSPKLHRMIFRGKNLGTSLTNDQKAQISAGTFKGLWLGDYWVIGGVTYRIADFDYWYNCGSTAFTRHHVVVIPDSKLYSAKMNDTNITEGGYYGSKMRGVMVEETFTPYAEGCGLASALSTFTTAFGSALLTHPDYICNAVADGKESAGAWVDSIVDLPSEIMMYGTSVRTPSPRLYTCNQIQLALMQADVRFIRTREDIWLRDVVSATDFADVNCIGDASDYNASPSLGVRPVAAVG